MRSSKRNTSEIYEIYDEQEPSSEKAEKISSKYRKRRRRKKLIKILTVVVILVVCGTVVLSFRPEFRISEIKVEGNVQMSPKEITEDSEIRKGESIFRFSSFLSERKMKKNPYYDSVKIKRDFPDRVIISIEERKPTIAFPYGERFVLINSDGIVMKLSDKNPELSEIVGVTIKEMERGKVLVTNDERLFEKSLEFISLVEKNDLFFKRIDMRKKNVRLTVYDNLYVKGRAEDICTSIKNGNLKKVLIDVYTKKIKRGTIVIGEDQTCSFTPKFN